MKRPEGVKSSRSRGQALAEFAIVFPVFFLILAGAVQFGMIFWAQNTLNQVVRDAGRYAVTVTNCSNNVADPTSGAADVTSKITAIAASTSLSATMDPPTVAFSADSGSSCPPASSAEHAWVNIEVHAHVAIFFPFLPGNGNISSAGLFRMEPAP